MSRRSSSLRAALAAACVPFLAHAAAAQCPNRWEAAPLQTLPGTTVSAARAFDDGNGLKMWAGVASLVPGQILRWDRARWSPLSVLENNGFIVQSTYLLALAPFDLGSGASLYALGFFERVDGLPVNSIARWTGSGWTALANGLRLDVENPAVLSAGAVFDDGSGPQLYVGGAIGGSDGVTPLSNIARWNGASWSAVGSGLNAQVWALKVFDDGSGPALFAAGEFTQAGGQPASRVARWNGSSWSNVGAGCSGTVHALEVFNDGTGARLYATGQFLMAGGSPASGIAAWDGSSWSALGTGLAGPSMRGRALSVRSEGGGAALYVGGNFSAAGGLAAPNVARWDGSSWSATGAGTDSEVRGFTEWSVCENGAPDLAAHGSFSSAGGSFAHRVALWSAGSWGPIAPSSGADSHVNASLVWDDGTGEALYAGGNFQRIGPTALSRLARWDGTEWSDVGGGLNGEVNALLAWDDGSGERLYAGGSFSQAGGVPAPAIARWNGAVWETIGGGIAGVVRALHVHDDGSGSGPLLYAAGLFNDTLHVRRWKNGAWEAMDGSVAGGGGGVVAGAFSMVSYSPRGGPSRLLVGTGQINGTSGIHRWDGSSWSLFAEAPGRMYALEVWSDPLGAEWLFAGGDFSFIGSLTTHGIARFDGALWQSLGSVDVVHDFETWDDGNGSSLYIGGQFATIGGVAANAIARWDGSAFHSISGGLSAQASTQAVRTISEVPGQDGLFVGGVLHDVMGSPTARMGWWLPDCSTVPYCVTSPNSAGAGALMASVGSTSVCAGDFTLRVTGAPANILGAFYYGPQAVQIPFGNGIRCVGGGSTGIFRLLPVSNTGAAGSASKALDFSKAPVGSGPGQILPGSSWCFQFWYRDPAGGGSGFNLSDAVQATFVP